MKRALLIPLIFLTLVIAKGQETRFDTIRYAKEHYQKRVATFGSEPVQKRRIIFLGNSIVEFGDWKKLLNDSTIVNRGIAGDNTFGVLDRLQEVIALEPEKLFIEIGINDISQNIPSSLIVRNIITIVERVNAKLPGTKIYVHSILPTNDNVKDEYPDAFGKNDQSHIINQQLKAAAVVKGFTYIELSNELKDKAGKLNEKYAQPDGIHLTDLGYQVWALLLKAKKYVIVRR